MKNSGFVTTQDGSMTLYSEEYDEHYHSLTGAYNEALYKFVKPSGILEKSVTQRVNVLDICFGLGYNSLVTLEQCKVHYPITIWAVEKDQSVIQKAILLNYPYKNWNHKVKELCENGKSLFKNGLIKLLLGDARKVINNIDEKFNIIYLDPFSTTKNPELWTYDFFKLLKNKLAPNGIIVTYSSALPVRSAFLMCGFYLYESEPVGRRRGGTIASLTPLYDQNHLPKKERYLLTYSDGAIPYRDRYLNSPPYSILIKRKEIVRTLLQKKLILKVKQCYKKQKRNIHYQAND